jgi:hypothetical protein
MSQFGASVSTTLRTKPSESRLSKTWEPTASRERAIPIWPLVAPATNNSRVESRRSTSGPVSSPASAGSRLAPSTSRRSVSAEARSSAESEASGSAAPPPAVSTRTSKTPKRRWITPCTVSTDWTCSRGIVRSFFWKTPVRSLKAPPATA